MTTIFSPDFVGFYGKLPVRGDFLRQGLPVDCIDALDEWVCASFAASRAELGNYWPKFWLQAPIWRFRLAAMICGSVPLIGIAMPSVDKAGRHFPLFLVAGAPDEHRLDQGAHWLDAAEEAGITAITADLSPDELETRLHLAAGETGKLPTRPAPSLWWTQGSPYRKAGSFTAMAMPSPDVFAAMLTDDQHAAAQSGQ